MISLDSEGRCLVTDHSTFVLFNVQLFLNQIYFPNGDSSDDRRSFKMRYSQAVQWRIEELVAQGRSVILVGDINVCAAEIDHCDPKKSIKELGIEAFQDTPARSWFNTFLYPKGVMHDTFRSLHPLDTRAYTVWNTLVNARYCIANTDLPTMALESIMCLFHTTCTPL